MAQIPLTNIGLYSGLISTLLQASSTRPAPLGDRSGGALIVRERVAALTSIEADLLALSPR